MDVEGQAPSTRAEIASVELSIPLENNDSETRILRKGDLVRIRKIADVRLIKYDGYLGKIICSRVIPKADLDGKETLENHPLLYDIDLVMGGKIANCHRREIQYTTADAEGMTDRVSRDKRMRKPSSIIQEQTEAQDLSRSKAVTAKKLGARKTAPKKATACGSKMVKSKTKKVNTVTAAHTKNPKVRTKPKRPITKQVADLPPETDPLEEDDDAITKNLFEKHSKDFERCLTRLEKADHFGFFFEAPLNDAVVDNQLRSNSVGSVTECDEASSSHTNAIPFVDSNSVPPSPLNEDDPFLKPPLTWFDLRERRDANRYILDRMTRAEKERKRRLGPYIWDKRKKRKQVDLSGKKASETLEIQDITLKESVKQNMGKRSLTRNGLRIHPRVLHPKGIDWELFRSDVLAMCDAHKAQDHSGGHTKAGTIGHAIKKVTELLQQIFERTAQKQIQELEFADARHEFTVILKARINKEAAFQGEWRKVPFPERKYQRLTTDVICGGLSPLDEWSASYEKQTELTDSFVGLAYSYNDTGASEGWMKSVFETAKSKGNPATGLTMEEERAANALAADDGVVRAQVRATMRTLLIRVQDKVLTERGVLKEKELRSANWGKQDMEMESPVELPSLQVADDVLSSVADSLRKSCDEPGIVEQSVWGIDCYTRQNVISCIEKDLDPETAVEFVEKWLLPAINACPVDLAHDLANAARILEGLPVRLSKDNDASQTLPLPVSSFEKANETWSHSLIGRALLHKINFYGPPWLKAAAYQLRRAIASLGYDFFRVHPKGHGSIVLSTRVKANTLVTFYRGEVYPSWRWGEKLDAIDMTQQSIGLRPNLPDFYNMALERPQIDPRGYGLMIVDASRKAGHGSMLSHSCDPTCEVRVSALNGQLCLAMTTLRDIEQGEELTFDYNAVTESLQEYQAAVCLCGYSKCRGSFLHFATADCYQRVLNRNYPIAVQLANLVKGCNKKVMADEDNQTLSRHGFGTAAFGAVSFNRHAGVGLNSKESRVDSMSNIPIWLRTYVADVLRYIEYERRALPVALLCDHLKNDESPDESHARKKGEFKLTSTTKKRQKREPRSKPENSFQFFVRINKEKFLESLGEEKSRELKGMEIQHAIRTVGSAVWKTLSEQEKADWKARAIAEWEANQAAMSTEGTSQFVATPRDTVKITSKSDKPQEPQSKDSGSLNLSRISFEAADAEGVSAMEQRIQQLTQALSRIGRVLYHHREAYGPLHPNSNGNLPETSIHPPLSIMTDHEVVRWIWCDQSGLVMTLLGSLGDEKCVPPSLHHNLALTVKEHTKLDEFVANPEGSGIVALEARRTLTVALLGLRDCLNDGLQELAKDHKKNELHRGRVKAKARRDESKLALKREILDILQNVVEEVVRRHEHQTEVINSSVVTTSLSIDDLVDAADVPSSPWLQHYQDRWKLEAAADILLLYARTSTFFKINPYSSLRSTPIEVYARELGNSIPLSAIKSLPDQKAQLLSNIEFLGEPTPLDLDRLGEGNMIKREEHIACFSNEKRRSSEPVFDADAVVASVTVRYSGEYVLSQLLQWFNGGIGHKQGLPDMVGCAILPSIKATFASSAGAGGKMQKSTLYRSQVRPRLFDWLRDPRQRGSAFPDELSKVLQGPESIWNGPILETLPIGSPVLDLLVMGDDSNINDVLAALDRDRLRDVGTGTCVDSATTRLESTIDEAMPAQAIAKWVQCEREHCLKWRRLPFFVDVDVLPEKFFCEDNIWNPEAQSCDVPEDVWDEHDSQVHNDGIEMACEKAKQDRGRDDNNKLDEHELKYEIGDRYDVMRTNKKTYCTGEVVDTDFKRGTKRVKLHFPKVPEKFDEWIEVPSIRIAPLFSKQFESEAEKKDSLTNLRKEAKTGNEKERVITMKTDPSSVATTLLSLRMDAVSARGKETSERMATLLKVRNVTSQLSEPIKACEKVNSHSQAPQDDLDMENALPAIKKMVDSSECEEGNLTTAKESKPSEAKENSAGKHTLEQFTNSLNDSSDLSSLPATKKLKNRATGQQSDNSPFDVSNAQILDSILQDTEKKNRVTASGSFAIPRKQKGTESSSKESRPPSLLGYFNCELDTALKDASSHLSQGRHPPISHSYDHTSMQMSNSYDHRSFPMSRISVQGPVQIPDSDDALNRKTILPAQRSHETFSGHGVYMPPSDRPLGETHYPYQFECSRDSNGSRTNR